MSLKSIYFMTTLVSLPSLKICTQYHFIWDHVKKMDIRLEYISTDQQAADIFIKPLSDAKFSYLRNILVLFNLS